VRSGGRMLRSGCVAADCCAAGGAKGSFWLSRPGYRLTGKLIGIARVPEVRKIPCGQAEPKGRFRGDVDEPGGQTDARRARPEAYSGYRFWSPIGRPAMGSRTILSGTPNRSVQAASIE